MKIGSIEVGRRDLLVGGGALAVGAGAATVVTGKLVSNASNKALVEGVRTARIQGGIAGAVLGAGLALGIGALVRSFD